MKKLFIITFITGLFSLTSSAQKTFNLKSPDGKIETNVSIDKSITYSVSHSGDLLLDKSSISITLDESTVWGENAKLQKSSMKSVNQIIDARIYKRTQIKDVYNELTLKFKDDYSLIFRAYDDGIAYRFVSSAKKPFVVENELAEFNFPADSKMFLNYANTSENIPLEQQFENSFEQPYHHIAISEWNKKRLGITPILIEGANGKRICITDADLLNYPGMFMYPSDKKNGLKAVFAPYPKETEQGKSNPRHISVLSREKYIAKFSGATTFPWRAIVIATEDKDLADNDMVYRLATPATGDFSWVKPGKVAWDWWNDWNLYGVDFRAGINNETYKYYIDFASKYGMEYVILDEGWSDVKKADLFNVIPSINIKELVEYGKSKNVGIILWASISGFYKDVEAVCKHYAEIGVKGFKVDFMDRDDQDIVDFQTRAAEIAAKYKVMLDYHGTYKPTGLQRTFPNVINVEAVHGLEQLKWNTTDDQVTHDVTIPFIRQIAGPMDYTQGAMRNAKKNNYRAVNSEAMSQGTRCHQLAEYVIFESPLSMLCDAPTNYMAESECTEFIATVPTVWDNTVALNGEIGKYVSIARKNGNAWYVGSLTNWDKRELVLDLSFLGEGNFTGEVFKDGINADRAARDYKKEKIDIPSDRKLKISLAPGGGYVVKITKK